MNYDNAVDRFLKRAQVTNRADLLCMRCSKIGTSNQGHIYSVHYNYLEQLPTRIQIQSALNRDFGSCVVMDPTSVMGGQHSITAKVFAKHPIEELSKPKTYTSNLTPAFNEKPSSCYVEQGDIIRYFDAAVTEGQVVGFNGDKFSVRVADKIVSVAADSVIDVKKSPKFSPVDQEAADYYSQLFPPEYVKFLVNNDPKNVENPAGK